MEPGARHRSLRIVAVLASIAALSGAPAAFAGTEGPCDASFNGVEVDRIDSLGSPLELDATDVLTFQGTDQVGTLNAGVEVLLAMVTVRDSDAVYGPVQGEFSASLDLQDVSPYGVGLFRVRGTTDNCTSEAWVRISGRFPFATLTGITAGGLALGGLAAQLTAIATRRRHSAWAAGIAGIVTGVGAAGIGQQFGRLQLSIPSLLIVACIAAIVGAVAAALLTPSEGLGWFAKRRAGRAQRRAIRYQARLEAARLDAERREAEQQAAIDRLRAEPAPRAEPEPQPEPEPRPDPKPDRPPAVIEGPVWCYVLAPVDAFDISDPERVIGVLEPGNWYLAKRQVGGWVQVALGEGADGWVAQSAIHKHG